VLKMMQNVLTGNFSEREVRRGRQLADRINTLGPEIKRLSDDDIRARTAEFRERLERGEDLDSLLAEAFATAREAADRATGLRPFDVQLIGGMVLHEGRIAEMKTGEGKTLVAVLPAYLNALTGKGVHIVTVNDYLARRDSEWMGQIYRFLGLEVGLIVHDLDQAERKLAYGADVTYGTNNEFGFDYLRDNMVGSLDEMVQRGFNYGIVDEVDSILIDEARTPLIISGPGTQSTELYYRFADVVKHLQAERDYTVDEKANTVAPTEEGVERVERLLGVENLYESADTDLSHYLMQALRAKALMKLDEDYVVKDGEVIIVDEFTGRMMFGRRYSDGLHQAIEAKEGVKIQEENQTLATITFQNYFRMYQKLAGMTGTAATEEEEFHKIYHLDVVVVPTHKPMIREDLPDLVYKTEEGKFKAVVEDIVERHKTGQPVLVGTRSIDKSEMLSRLLEKRGVPHQVLNAKHHEREAQIIALAGQAGTVTIATNMAGRGTDIVLGEGVPSLGGLHILGTERHESRRIDNQLRGRSGRQGDPGSSQFYVSLEDELMRIFGGERMQGLMGRLGMDDEQPIESPMLTRAIENAQRKVESRNFDTRKHVLEYDDVMNLQRHVIYQERRRILEGEELRDQIFEFLHKSVDSVVDRFCTDGVHPDEWNRAGLVQFAEQIFLDPGQLDPKELEGQSRDMIRTIVRDEAEQCYERREALVGPEVMRQLERMFLLHSVDEKWVMHLDAMDDLRDGVNLRAYGQRDPLVEYKREAFEMFQDMTDTIQDDALRMICKVQIVQQAPPPPPPPPVFLPSTLLAAGGGESNEPRHSGKTVGRNDPCPCGSGKKYKHCHGRNAS